MSSFLFSRRASPEGRDTDSSPQPAAQFVPDGIVQAQAITASAIFAMLVSKGVLSAEEAASYMEEIGLVLARDVEGPVGEAAGNLLRSYGQALIAADE